MTLQHTYGTNGACDSFAFSFAIDTEADLQVQINAIEQTSGFTIHGAGSPGGGVVVFLAPPSAGKTILIRHRGRVAVTSADASSGYLADKLVAGAGIALAAAADVDGRQSLVISSTDGGSDLDAAQNLADLTDKAVARANLGVYSTLQVDNAIATSSDLDLKKAQNLADLADKPTARTNLGVYAKADVHTKAESDAAYADKTLSNVSAVPARTNLDVYAKGDVYTKAETDAAHAAKGDVYTKAEVYTKAQSDAAYAAKGDVYTKIQSDAAYADKTLSNVTAATARTNLGLEHVAYLNVAQAWDAPQRNLASQSASVGGSVVLNMATYQNFDLTLSADITFANPSAAMVGQRGTIGIIPNGFAIAGMGDQWKRVGDTGAPSEITGQGRIDYHIRSTGRIEYTYNDVEA